MIQITKMNLNEPIPIHGNQNKPIYLKNQNKPIHLKESEQTNSFKLTRKNQFTGALRSLR